MNRFRNLLSGIFAVCLAAASCAQLTATVVEYYNPSLDAYFISGRPYEQSLLNGSSGFQRTGMTFQAYTAATTPGNLPLVCRYYVSTTKPFSSTHFYGTTGGDCELISALSPVGFSDEGFDFGVQKPSNLVGCSGAWPYPVYRSFRAANNGITANHRYSTSLASYNAMLQRGWTGEGITFCAMSVSDALANLASSPAGIWRGRSSNGGSNIYALVAPSGETWVLYTDTGGKNYLAGVVSALLSTGNGTYSGAARDFSFYSRSYVDARVSGTYALRNQLSGVVFYPSVNQSISFSSTYDPDYDVAASLAVISGTYAGTGTSLYGTENLTLAIQSNGTAIGITAAGCTFSGSILPMTAGNLYRVNVVSQGAQCNGETISVAGVAFFDSVDRKLIIATADGNRTNAFVYLGIKN